LITGLSGYNLGTTAVLGYKLGAENKRNIKQKKRECVPRGSTRLSQISKQLSRVATLLVHVSTCGPHLGAGHLTSGFPTCHVAFTYWSTSAATLPGTCHVTIPQVTTSSDASYVAAYHEATSLFEIQQLDT
jgi:hypothetical protein